MDLGIADEDLGEVVSVTVLGAEASACGDPDCGGCDADRPEAATRATEDEHAHAPVDIQALESRLQELKRLLNAMHADPPTPETEPGPVVEIPKAGRGARPAQPADTRPNVPSLRLPSGAF